MKIKSIIIILILILLFATYINQLNQPKKSQPIKCEDNYTVKCYNYDAFPIKMIKNSIPCSIDKDCSLENMNKFCTPGYAGLTDCIGTEYYCGDNICKGYTK